MNIKTVGVVGCGLMGSGIAEVIAKRQYDVVVMEVNQSFLDKGLERIQKSLARAVERRKLTAAERDATWTRIRGTTDLAQFGACDCVVEAAIENLEEKKKVFARLDQVTPPHAILSSNTSSLSIIDMAAATKRPEQVLGMHFLKCASQTHVGQSVQGT